MDNLREQAKGAAMIFLKNYDKNDYDELLKRWESSSSGSDVRKQIEIRMIEMNKEQLARIASYDELLKRWEKFKVFRC